MEHLLILIKGFLKPSSNGKGQMVPVDKESAYKAYLREMYSVKFFTASLKTSGVPLGNLPTLCIFCKDSCWKAICIKGIRQSSQVTHTD